MTTRTRRPDRTGSVAAARRAGDDRMNPRTTVLLVVGGVAVLAALIVAVLVAGGDSSDDATTAADAPPSSLVTDGTALAPLPETGTDPAVGEAMPRLEGTDLNGEPLTVGQHGRPTLVMFLAHWCPHCQAEVPVVQEWVDGGNLPESVDITAVATANDPRRPNHPAAAWLEHEGWTAPTLLDDGSSSAAEAAGVTSFPFWVAVDGNGTVVQRTTGELGPDQLTAMAEDLAGRAS